MEDVKIFASIVDEETEKQIEELSLSEAYKDATIRVMPDCHAGKGCTIGSVIKYTDKVVPNTVGVDIGCGVLVCLLGNVAIDLKKLDEVVNTYVPSGFNVHEEAVNIYELPHSLEILNASISNKNYIYRSIGTLGGGNHFIELDVDDEDNKYLVIHSGSRNLGVKVCDYWQSKAIANLTDNSAEIKALISKLKEEGRANEIQSELKKIKKPEIKKDLAYLEGQDLAGYLHDMNICQEYARINRLTIAEIILRNLELSYKCRGSFETIHNYIDIPNKTIRKGAISANKGEKVIIPMNMRDGSLLCVGLGNEDWLNSAPHGAGRIMSRNEARDNLKLEDFEHSMENIYTTSVCKETIDEAPMVYKDAKQIMKDIIPTVEVYKVIKPIYNFKAKG